MKTLSSIPVQIDLDYLLKKMFLEPGSIEAGEFSQLLNDVRPYIKPQAIYTTSAVEVRGETTVNVGPVTFESAVLKSNIENLVVVHPFVVTCGRAFDDYLVDESDFLAVFWLDAIKSHVQREAFVYLRAFVRKEVGVGQLSSICPGTGEPSIWDIDDLKLMMELFPNMESEIGVTLTEDLVMIPNKSLGGLLFEGDWHYKDCENCPDLQCPERDS